MMNACEEAWIRYVEKTFLPSHHEEFKKRWSSDAEMQYNRFCAGWDAAIIAINERNDAHG